MQAPKNTQEEMTTPKLTKKVIKGPKHVCVYSQVIKHALAPIEGQVKGLKSN